MSQSYINQILQRFADQLKGADQQTMTLTLRAELLHEAKRLQSTLTALLLQKELQNRELLLLASLNHFITCARLEAAETLRNSCRLFQRELQRVVMVKDAGTGMQAAA